VVHIYKIHSTYKAENEKGKEKRMIHKMGWCFPRRCIFTKFIAHIRLKMKKEKKKKKE
jgi:hypothetical protein